MCAITCVSKTKKYRDSYWNAQRFEKGRQLHFMSNGDTWIVGIWTEQHMSTAWAVFIMVQNQLIQVQLDWIGLPLSQWHDINLIEPTNTVIFQFNSEVFLIKNKLVNIENQIPILNYKYAY